MNFPNLLFVLACSASTTAFGLFDEPKIERNTSSIEGWSLHVDNKLLREEKAATAKARKLLKAQLQEIIRVVPSEAVTELQKVPLYFSPEYPDSQQRAEYHPGADWLKDNNRDPVMAKAVEFTNIRIFERETQRMPNFALHELAHAYHDRFLPDGFANKDIQGAFERARAAGFYAEVEQRFGDGRSARVKAYAITNPMEYFAECSEAFFSTNDFFPFHKEELQKHDPEIFELLHKLWRCPEEKKAATSGEEAR